MSHDELDQAADLDRGSPAELAEQYRQLRGLLPGLVVVGGCCGTDHERIAAITEHAVRGGVSVAAPTSAGGRRDAPPGRCATCSEVTETTRRLAGVEPIGREDELADIVARVTAGRRLVTIVGPGGIGKTTLARAASARLDSDARDGTARRAEPGGYAATLSRGRSPPTSGSRRSRSCSAHPS